MSFELKKLSNKIWVTGQIMVSNIANIKAQGFNTIINNRFDGEIRMGERGLVTKPNAMAPFLLNFTELKCKMGP